MFEGIRNLSSPDRPLSDRIGSLLVPYVFLSSIAVGFLLASLCGTLSASRPLFRDFVRIHQLIGSESFFNVTALQVWRLLESHPANKVEVIIGGSSRFNGVGQTEAGLWSRHLQSLLGPDYRVTNLALRAGSPDQFGAYVAEAMIKEGRQVIYAADTIPAYGLTALGTFPAYRYLYYDARARGLLLESRARDERVKSLEELPDLEADLQELRLRASLNRIAYFDDLWTYIGYRYLFVGAWSAYALPSPMKARIHLRDPAAPVPTGGFYERYDFEQDLSICRHVAKIDKSSIFAAEKSLQTQPRTLRVRSVWVTIYDSPYYTRHFTSDEQRAYARNFAESNAALHRAGYSSLVLGTDWEVDDFVDRTHLSEQGGRKLAEAVAPLIAEKAKQLGYLK